MATKSYTIANQSNSSSSKTWSYTIKASEVNKWVAQNIPSNTTVTSVKLCCYLYKNTTLARGSLVLTVAGTEWLNLDKKINSTADGYRYEIKEEIKSKVTLSGSNVGYLSGDIVFNFSSLYKARFYIEDISITYTYPEIYTLSASSNGYGTVTGGGTYTEGSSAILSATPNAGYYVEYWMKDGVRVENTGNITNYTATVDANHTYTVVFAPVNYTIAFDGNGATGGSTGSINTKYGETVYLPSCGFTKTGYHFIDWRGDIGNKKVGESVSNLCYTNNATYIFTAQWDPNIFSIRYNPNGASGDSILQNEMSVEYVNLPIQANSFIRPGYTFTNWNTIADGSGTNFAAGKYEPNIFLPNNGEIIDLYAQWVPNSYIINFQSNGGIGSMSVLSMLYDTSQELPLNTFTKAGHTFIGWNTEQDGSGDHYEDGATVINLAESGQPELWAQWEPIKYTITWKDWDGSELEQKEWDYGSYPSYSNDTELLSYETYEAFYDFYGWSPNVSSVSGNTTYTATYLKTIKTYTVTWVDWNGDVLETDTNVPYGTMPTFDYTITPSRESDDPKYYYVFDSWDTEIVPVTGHITYTAVYVKNTNKYTVTWKDYNGDVLETDTDVVYDTPPSYDREDPTRERTELYEYKFVGWKTEISDEYADEDDLSVVRANITYIAVYEEIERMYSFSVNILPSAECGRVEGYTDSEYKYGSELTLTAFPNDGYQFVSWSYTVDGVAQTAMRDTLEISIFEDTEITAIFEERSGLPTMVNETQVEAAYVNPDALTITYVISGDQIESTIQNDIVTSVDGWSFVVSNQTPEIGYKVDNIYIDDIQIY